MWSENVLECYNRHMRWDNENKSKTVYSSASEETPVKIRVEGVMTSVAFQKARLCAERLHSHFPSKFAEPRIREMFQTDWYEHLQKLKRNLGGKLWELKSYVAVFVNDEFIGSDVEFLRYINQSYILNLPVELEYYESLAAEQFMNHIEKTKRDYVYFTFTVNDSVIGSFLFMLYSDLLPRTCRYFLRLCNGTFESDNARFSYLKTKVHRIVKNGWIQCGDIEVDIDNVDSDFDNVVIPDESYCVPHDRRGVLSLTNDGKHRNGPQFFVSLQATPWMNYHYVAFGQLVEGARTLETIEGIPTFYESPEKEIVISSCGEYSSAEEPRVRMETDVFLPHCSEPGVGEEAEFCDLYSGDSDVTPWLDNVTDQ